MRLLQPQMVGTLPGVRHLGVHAGTPDLPGGDQVQMWATLRFLASAIDPDTVLLPGHGAATTMAHEHHANPYLAEARIRGGDRHA